MQRQRHWCELALCLCLLFSHPLLADPWLWADHEEEPEGLKTQPIKLEFKKKVDVSLEQVFLSDIANCSGDEQKCAEASGIAIGKSPDEKATLLLNPDKIKSIIAQEWPVNYIEYVGLGMVQVRSLFYPKTKQEIEEFITEMLEKAADSSFRLKLNSLQLLGTLSSRDENCSLQSEDLDEYLAKSEEHFLERENRLKRMKIFCVSQEFAEIRSQDVIANFGVLKEVLVAKRSIDAHRPLTENDIELSWEPIEGGSYFVDSKQAISMLTRTRIKASQVINPRLLFVPNAIERGQKLTLVIASGLVSVKSPAEALGSGRIGEHIEVKQTNNNKKIRAKIIDKQTVAVGNVD